jgi:hypothetical protein
MNYISKLRELEPAQIRSDRELLSELGMTDAAAANYLGKSRQALNLKLGSRRANEVREPYFKLSEILVLVIAAQNKPHPFDHEAVWRFVEETAPQRVGGSEETYQLLRKRLNDVHEVDLAEVGTVVMILPAFADMRAQLPAFVRDLRRLAGALDEARPRPWIAVLSSSKMQAEMAAEWLTLPKDKARWFTHEFVDYYPPSVLVFPREKAVFQVERAAAKADGSDRQQTPRPYTLSERGTLAPAPQFRAHSIGEHVKFMLPPEARAELFTYEDEAGDDDDEVMHRKHG